MGMSITRCNNGWILQLPRIGEHAAMLKQMIPGIINAARGADDSDIETLIKGDEDELQMVGRMPNPRLLVEVDTYVFLKFKDMVGFIDLALGDLEHLESKE